MLKCAFACLTDSMAMKIRQTETKHLLKQVARRYFPAAMVDRPKEGFLMPITQWFQNDLRAYVCGTLGASRLARHGFFRQGEVDALVARVYQPGSDYTDVNRVLALVVFQEWFDLYMS